MQDNIVKVRSDDLLEWIYLNHSNKDLIREVFPHLTRYTNQSTYYEFLPMNDWRLVNDFTDIFRDSVFFQFDTKEIKDQFLKDNPDFPVSKSFNEEHPLTLIVNNIVLERYIEYNDSNTAPEIKEKFKEYFLSDVDIGVPHYNGMYKNWSSGLLLSAIYFYIEFKTEDDFVLFKMSSPPDLAINL